MMANYKFVSQSNGANGAALSKGAHVRSWIAGILAGLAALGSLRLGVFSPDFWGARCLIWQSALGEAAAHGEKFGHDVIFTGGPIVGALHTIFRIRSNGPGYFWWER